MRAGEMQLMPRLRRFLKWAGLGVCTALVVAWATSGSHISLTALYHRFLVTSGSGGMILGLNKAPMEASLHTGRQGPIRWLPSVSTNLYQRWDVTIFVPYWCLLLLIGTPTAVLWKRDRRIPPGCCQHCGYDLRGSKDKCPECGHEFGSSGSDLRVLGDNGP